MKFGIYLPPQAQQRKVPVLCWLSGLTCTEQNFIAKAAVQRYASEHVIIVVAPDTSPRGEGVADDPAYDLGQGRVSMSTQRKPHGLRTIVCTTMSCRSCQI